MDMTNHKDDDDDDDDDDGAISKDGVMVCSGGVDHDGDATEESFHWRPDRFCKT